MLLPWLYFTVGSLCFALLWILKLLELNIPLLEHGKTLKNKPLFMVPKRWFAHFYLIGFICSLFKWSPFTVHLARRFLEETWIAPHSADSKMHVLHYLMGVTFYPMVILLLEVSFDKRTLACFCLMQLFQCLVHHELHLLKRKSGYVPLPRQGLFRYLLCPHYLCEIVIYGLIMWKGSRSMLPLFTFVALNVSLSAYNTRKWYQKQFGPDPRAAIIPGIL